MEGNRDSDSACEFEATPSHGAHELLAHVIHVQQNCTDSSLDSSYLSGSISSTVTVGSNPSNLVLFTKGKIIEIVKEMSDRLYSTERKEVL